MNGICKFCSKKTDLNKLVHITKLSDDGTIVRGLACIKCNPDGLPSYIPSLEQILKALGAKPDEIKRICKT